jgi:hypothetical protein
MTSISPPAAVLDIAPAKVLQGAVRLQGLASSPTPDTQVRVACALATATEIKITNKKAVHFANVTIFPLLLPGLPTRVIRKIVITILIHCILPDNYTVNTTFQLNGMSRANHYFEMIGQ